MTSRPTLLTPAIRRALAASCLVAALPALAEDTAPTTSLDRLQVTGSRIRQVDLETAQPVVAITRADIERQGVSSVADILQQVTAMGSADFGRSDTLASDAEAGGTYIDMRNLGSQRTLVLINGKRLGMSTSGLQDLSTIPVSAIERIEVLKDGASALYGSDAMAGVVNVITRSNAEGVVANIYHGQYSQGDGARTRYDVVAGWSTDSLSLTLAAEHAEEKDIWAKNRWFSRSNYTDRHPADGWSQVSQWGQVNGLVGGPGCSSAKGCNYSLDRGTDPLDPSNYHLSDPTGITGDVSNANSQMHLIPPMTRDAVFLDARWDINEHVRLSSQLGYNTRRSVSTIAGYPLQSAAVGQMSADSWFNPFGSHHGYDSPTAVSWNRRTWEMPRTFTRDLTAYRAVVALEGSFDLGERYVDWDAGYQYNKTTIRERGIGNLHKQRVRDAVGPSYQDASTGRIVCGTPDAPIANCMPWNPLVPYGTVDANGLTGNDALIAWLFPTSTARGETSTRSLFANIAGSVISLPAGDLAAAFGVESRREAGRFIPDALAQTGATTDLAAGPTGGGYTVDEAYLELQIPLLADLPGVRALTLNTATRFSSYDTFGNTLNSKFGFTWKPLDQLLVRGTWAEGFRAPTINDLYGGGSETFATFHDPCDTVYGAAASNAGVRARCARDIAKADAYRQLGQGMVPTTSPTAATPVPFVGGSNPLLQPETSISRTLGIVWSPTFAEHLNVTLDWWQIRIDNTIVDDNPNQILIDCYEKDIDARCALFERDPVTGIVQTLRYGNRNAGFTRTEGYDLEIGYRLPTRTAGTFSANLASTYVVSGIERSTDDAAVVPTPFNGINDALRLRANLSLGWERGDLGVSWTARYHGATKERCLNAKAYPDECSNPGVTAPWYAGLRDYNRLPAVVFHDVQVRYALPWNGTVTVGANNVFGTYGPAAYHGDNSSFAYNGDHDIGRFMYMKYQQRF